MDYRHSTVPIIATSDLDASQSFYERLGFTLTSDFPHNGYRILHDEGGASIHLTFASAEWVQPERNATGIYFYNRDIEALAARIGAITERKPWGLTEFAISDPSGTLVRVGWPNPASS